MADDKKHTIRADDLAAVLVVAESGTEACKNLYRYYKEVDERYSLAFFCKRAQIPSTGYLSDVMAGKRKLNKRYWQGLAEAFELRPIEQQYFECVLRIDSRSVDDDDLQSQGRELARLRKSLLTRRGALPSASTDFCNSLEIFCAFGLFHDKPSRNDLVGYFGNEYSVDKAIEQLLELDLIETCGGERQEEGADQDEDGDEDTHEDRYRPTTDLVVFDRPGGRGTSRVDFIRGSMRRAMDDIDRWFDQKEEAHFTSTIVSVNGESYRRMLAALKEYHTKMIAEVESKDADHLVRFNVQSYPIRSDL